MQQQAEEFSCPSFSSYSLNSAAEVAAKISDEVVEQLHREVEEKFSGADNEEDFEFSLICENPDASISEFFYDRPVYPVFNRDLLLDDVSINGESSSKNVQISLKELFLEEREAASSSSSSEVDDLESVPPGTYCVWKPKTMEPSPSRCKKSNSTGSAFKRWNIRDLMRRSNSEGKDSFVFLTPEKGTKNTEAAKVAGKSTAKVKNNAGEKAASSSAAANYQKNKRKSYLPYRRDLVGLFANVNSFGRTFPPF